MLIFFISIYLCLIDFDVNALSQTSGRLQREPFGSDHSEPNG
jgi:hypothetical protein